MNRRVLLSLSSALGVALMCSGCRSDSAYGPDLIGAHDAALARSSPTNAPPPGSDVEKAAIARFVDFYRVYSSESIRRGVRDLYASDAYFGDPFKSVNGINAIEDYFLKMAETVVSCTFTVTSTSRSAEGEYFIRWVMDLTAARAKKAPLRVLGLSQVRFNAQGQVIFHQDYWDTSTLFERLPVVGGPTRFVKRRLEK